MGTSSTRRDLAMAWLLAEVPWQSSRCVRHLITADDLFPEELSSPPPPVAPATSLREHLDRSERAYLVSVVQECDGAVGAAAARMGISRKTLWEKMRRHGIDRQQFERERDSVTGR